MARARRFSMAFCAGGAAGVCAFAPASAQGFFERLFGGFQRAFEPPRLPADISAYSRAVRPADRAPNLAGAERRRARAGDGLLRAHLRRLFLPGAGACRHERRRSLPGFCPASETRIYPGRKIASAVANDGRRYADLPNAFPYRKTRRRLHLQRPRRLRSGACRPRLRDPTLRPGDIVATETGWSPSPAEEQSGRLHAGEDYSHFSQELPRQTCRRCASCRRRRRARGAVQLRGARGGDDNRRLSSRDSRPLPAPATATRSAPATRCRTSAPGPAGRAAPAHR